MTNSKVNKLGGIIMAKELHFTPKDMPIGDFNRMELKGRIETNPEYQRDFVYSVEKFFRLIESALTSNVLDLHV